MKPKMSMDIHIFARSTLAILAVITLVTMIGGIVLNNPSLINLGWKMFVYMTVTVIIVTGLINLPKIVRVLQ